MWCGIPCFSIAYDSAVMCGGFQGGPQLGPPDAERRQSLEQLKTVCDGFPVW